MNAALKEAARACDFWTGLEYMNLPKAPDAEERQRVYRVESNADLPWKHVWRKSALQASDQHKFKAQIAYCGLMSKRDCTASLRRMLGSAPMGIKDMRNAGDAAMVLIPLDDTGRVCGEVFISSYPWLMGRLKQHLAKNGAPADLDLSGFDDYQESLMKDVRQLLVQLQLIRGEEAQSAVKPTQGAKSAPGEKGQAQAGMEVKQAGDGAVAPLAGAAELRDGAIAGPADMLPLELSHVEKVLSVVWMRAGWRPDWGAYAEEPAGATKGQGHLVRIKLVTMTRYHDRAVDLGTMNSLVANDVIRVRGKLAAGEAVGQALQQYLKTAPHPAKIDLRDDNPRGGLGHFVSMLDPTRMPAGAWPDFPLVSAQQFAVNMSREHLADSGLYGVNGPPGTGKSTLLRDVIAARIVDRATVMASFAKPTEAFVGRAKIEGREYGYERLHEKLLGHGIVVASSNNGAVENVIKDLPKLSKPMAKSGATYFRAVAESVATGPKGKKDAPVRDLGSAWGLVAALMGSSDKKRAFLRRFWFDSQVDPDAQPMPDRLRSLRGVVIDGSHGAKPWREARDTFWKSLKSTQERAHALKEGIEVYKRVEANLKQSHQLAEHIAALAAAQQLQRQRRDELAQAVNDAQARLKTCKALRLAISAVDKAQASYDAALAAAAALPTKQAAISALDEAVKLAALAEEDVKQELKAEPKLFERCFKWSAHGQWRKKLNDAKVNRTAARKALQDAQAVLSKTGAATTLVAECERAYADHMSTLGGLEAEAKQRGLPTEPTDGIQHGLELSHAASLQKYQQAEDLVRARSAEIAKFEDQLLALEEALRKDGARRRQIDQLLTDLGESFYDDCDLLKPRDEELQLMVPYKDDVLRGLRVQVFCDAMQVNQSFVVEAWPKLSSSLSAFVDYQTGKISQAQAGQAAVHLWNAFFTVVPVVSSTFASFDKLFSGLGREDIGLLLIDEAGQSAPQNALGAIWRSRRVISVGDPLQLEPVVPQPVEALSAWREWTGADQLWAPPRCSTQVLADEMTPYGTVLRPHGEKEPGAMAGGEMDEGDDARSVWVGSPLRVHRRCLNPMFNVANKIAYANLMVHGVKDDTDHDDWLGPSRWYDVRGEGQGHWVQAQGDVAMKLVHELLASSKLGGQLKNEKGEWHINVITPYKDVGREFGEMLRARFKHVPDIKKMSGTVHTFQGKEADVVILLLGGNPEKEGAVSFFAGNEQSPNLLNVALTRAKKRIYVVGDKEMWTGNSGTFRELALQLEEH